MDLTDILEYYRRQGAPREQAALVQLLKEIQQEMGGSIPSACLPVIAGHYDITVNFLHAVIRRIPSLRLSGNHVLEICAGPNCGKHRDLCAWAEKLQKKGLTVKFVGCMRLCGKGPNVRLDGQVYHNATTALLDKLTQDL